MTYLILTLLYLETTFTTKLAAFYLETYLDNVLDNILYLETTFTCCSDVNGGEQDFGENPVYFIFFEFMFVL